MSNIVQITIGTESPNPGPGLQARLHDPLWLLARQWQLGEFQGEDSGSPVSAAIRYETAPLTRFRPGPGRAGLPPQPYSSQTVPLEALVEREPANGEDLRASVEAGQHLARLLAREGLGALSGLLQEYRLTPADPQSDLGSRAFLGVVAGRALDGNRLHALFAPLNEAGRLADIFKAAPFDSVADGDQPRLLTALNRWLAWYGDRFGAAGGEPQAWVPERMEYGFAVSAAMTDGETVLAAPEYLEGHLDWHSFVAEAEGSLGATQLSETIAKAFLPAPVSYPGMPSPRFWEFEDGRINFAKLEASPDDPARRLLMSFALEYGNDWFVVPLELETGSLCRIRSLTVTDSFGGQWLIPHVSSVDGADSPWSMFSLSQAPRDLFFLPPVLGPGLQGTALEDVHFLRDEMANLAWAVERVVSGAAGRPLDRHEAYQQSLPQGEQPVRPRTAAGALPRYRLGTTVPDYWIPLLPVRHENGLRLKRARLPDAATGTGHSGPLGRILAPWQELLLNDEEVPREGARVTRACQYHRWIGGSTQLWVGRQKRPGRGEGSSGLQFDVLTQD